MNYQLKKFLPVPSAFILSEVEVVEGAEGPVPPVLRSFSEGGSVPVPIAILSEVEVVEGAEGPAPHQNVSTDVNLGGL